MNMNAWFANCIWKTTFKSKWCFTTISFCGFQEFLKNVSRVKVRIGSFHIKINAFKRGCGIISATYVVLCTERVLCFCLLHWPRFYIFFKLHICLLMNCRINAEWNWKPMNRWSIVMTISEPIFSENYFLSSFKKLENVIKIDDLVISLI